MLLTLYVELIRIHVAALRTDVLQHMESVDFITYKVDFITYKVDFITYKVSLATYKVSRLYKTSVLSLATCIRIEMSRLFTYKQRDDLLYKERDVSNTQRDVYVSKRQSYAYLLELSEMTYFISSEI